MNSDAKVPISRSLETERLYLRGAVADDAPAVNAAVIASWTELSPVLDWAQGAQPTIQETMERINNREAGFEDRSELHFSIPKKGRLQVPAPQAAEQIRMPWRADADC